MDINQASKIMKALSHPNRLELYLKIVKGEQNGFEAKQCYISDLVENLKICSPTISHHLKELVNAGLIVTERDGKLLTAKPILATWEEVKKMIDG